jgi:hypothetical protein
MPRRQFRPHPSADPVEHGHQRHDGQQQGRQPAPLEQRHRFRHQQPDAADADQPEHGGVAHVEFPDIQMDAERLRQHGARQRMRQGLQRRHAQHQAGVDQPPVHGLDGFRIQLAVGAERMKGDRQDAGHGPEADDADQQQAEYQRMDGARRVQQQPGGRGGPTRHQHVAGGDHAERQRRQCRDQRAERRHLERGPGRFEQAGQVAALGRLPVLDAQHAAVVVAIGEGAFAAPGIDEAGARQFIQRAGQVLQWLAAELQVAGAHETDDAGNDQHPIQRREKPQPHCAAGASPHGRGCSLPVARPASRMDLYSVSSLRTKPV